MVSELENVVAGFLEVGHEEVTRVDEKLAYWNLHLIDQWGETGQMNMFWYKLFFNWSMERRNRPKTRSEPCTVSLLPLSKFYTEGFRNMSDV